MTSFHASIRNVLSEIDSFFSETLRGEKVSKKATLHKEKILDLVFRLRQEYPELSPRTAEFTRNDVDFIPDLAARELKNITKAGFLEKRRKKAQNLFQRGAYQRRYCVIQKGVFYYYVNPTDKKQAGAFHLKGYKFRKAPYLPDDGNKKDLSFELVCPGKRSFQFLAEISQDFKAWKDAVEEESVEKKKEKPKVSTNIDPDDYVDADDNYYVPVNSDDDRLNPASNDADSSDGESYELINSPLKPETGSNGNHKTDKPKPPVLPKKAVPKPPKQSPSTRAPLKPPVPPKHDRGRKEDRGTSDGGTYVDCESRRTDDDDDDDDDDDYTEPIDFGRYTDSDIDEDLEPHNNKNGGKGFKKPLEQTDSQDLYYADATSAPPRSSVSSDLYQDASSGGGRK